MKKTCLFASLVYLCLSTCAFSIGGDMGAGTEPLTDGSETYPWLIEDLDDFDTFSDPNYATTYWASGVHTYLMTDIDLSGRTYTTAVIAPDTNTNSGFQGIKYEGVFDGNGYIIGNLSVDTQGSSNDYLGLFGYLSVGQVENLGIEDIDINSGNGSEYIGSLCGYSYSSNSISDCYSTGLIIAGDSARHIGGLCGYKFWNEINSCYSTVSISVANDSVNVGGLCGTNLQGDISNCYSSGMITSQVSPWNVGGLCGSLGGDYSGITNSYSTSTVTGGDESEQLGGLCGMNSGLINACYSSGSVNGGDRSEQLGGLSGENFGGQISNCYSTGSVYGGNQSELLGSLIGNNSGHISSCYSVGRVSGEGSYMVAGLCGRNFSAITNCYFYFFSGPDNKEGIILDETQMTDSSSFIGFDFVGNSIDGSDDYWDIVSGHCPKLTWQTDNGPLLNPSPLVTTLLGSGHPYDPFQINNETDFTEFINNNNLNCGYYTLNTDIDLSGNIFTAAVINRHFGNSFDGNNHVVRNITINAENTETYQGIGLFFMFSGIIENLGVENIYITGGDDNRGGLVGTNYAGNILRCYSTGRIESVNSTTIGGLCGYNFEGTISRCYSRCDVLNSNNVSTIGGLCGYNFWGYIDNCYSTGVVTGTSDPNYIGGFCGYNWVGTITDCYSTSTVINESEPNDISGFLGKNSSGVLSNCFWDLEASGTTDGVYNVDPDPTGVMGKSTSEMMTQSTFTDAGWDFTTPIWMMLREYEDYPRLAWQEIYPGDIAGLYGADIIDFAYLSQYWGLTDCGGVDDCGRADIDNSGDVGLPDLLEVAYDWLN